MSHSERHWPSAEAVFRATMDLYEVLPRTGKPQPHEYTVLASIVLYEDIDPAALNATEKVTRATGSEVVGTMATAAGRLSVLALATGTKCLGAAARDPGGEALNDCHAEVLARRALILALHEDAETLISARDGGGADASRARILRWRGDKAAWPPFEQRPETSLHMCVSRPPCGDACVVAADGAGGCLVAGVRGALTPGRTGAKIVVWDAVSGETSPSFTKTSVRTDAHDASGQLLGRCRRKPGRGDGTCSMSCSDKIAKWALLGLQGGLWAGLLAAPLALATVSVVPDPGTDPDAALGALRRVLRRGGAAATHGGHGDDGLAVDPPRPLFPRAPVPLARVLRSVAPETLDAAGLLPSHVRKSAAGGSLVWHRPSRPNPARGLRATVEGLTGTLGVRTGHRRRPGEPVPPTASSTLCKARLGRRMRDLRARLGAPALPTPYDDAKCRWGAEYHAEWARLRKTAPFQPWLPKPPSLFLIGDEPDEGACPSPVAARGRQGADGGSRKRRLERDVEAAASVPGHL